MTELICIYTVYITKQILLQNPFLNYANCSMCDTKVGQYSVEVFPNECISRFFFIFEKHLITDYYFDKVLNNLGNLNAFVILGAYFGQCQF